MLRKWIILLVCAAFLAGCQVIKPEALEVVGSEQPEQTDLAAPTPAALAGLSAPEQAAKRKFSVQTGTPVQLPNIARPNVGCNWTGVGGQVFGTSGAPVSNIVVEVEGSLNGNKVSAVGLTGSMKNLGPAGYDVTLADKALASSGSALTIQLKDTNGNPLSDKIPFATSADCSKNMVLINFQEFDPGRIMLPMIVKRSRSR